MSMFQQRHYAFLARWLDSSRCRANSAHTDMTLELAALLSEDNPRFNRDKFLEASGFAPEYMPATKPRLVTLERTLARYLKP